MNIKGPQQLSIFPTFQQLSHPPSKMSKVILVTGGNAGIGYELVKALASKPDVHKVYLAARNEGSGREAQDTLRAEGLGNVHFIHLDVTDVATIISAKEAIEKNDGKLDILVNNAGIGEGDKDQKPSTVEVDTVRRVLETNLLGLIQTTTTFVPLLRRSPQAVILNVGSELGSNTWMSNSGKDFFQFAAYSASKAAVSSYTINLAHELKADGIKVNVITPGYTATKINGYAPTGKTSTQGAAILVPWAMLEKDGPSGKSDTPVTP
ncbi:hypothetical protein D9611_011086 [Ephemerocybe angulata]|uniref:NAD(P)-binding protein n=1 Tax=Ephemerocybe angulata TaxID=980116 RepID=A0A8H5BBE9_9AGAR|nr:hypothetical protein D9611_011086 [Tulosesus angulatus]